MNALNKSKLSPTLHLGFSLVELLVAMTLLIMVTLIGTYGYNLYSRYWQKELGHYQETFLKIKGVTQLHSAIKNIKPYIFKGGESGAYHYFEGSQKVMRSITNHALSHNGYPAAFELEATQLQGVNRLVYRERPMSSGPFFTEADISAYSFEVVLLEGYHDLTFEYYGWPSYQIRASTLSGDSETNEDQRKWYGLYSGKDTLLPPELIRLNYVDIDGELSVFELPVSQIVEQHLEFYLIDD